MKNQETPRLFDIDWAMFHPWRVQPVRHHLADHPLLQLGSLVDLGARLSSVGRVRTHSSDASAGTSFNAAPQLCPNDRAAVDTLANIESAKAWMSLLNVQTDEIYRRLVDEVLDDLRPAIERVDPGMAYRAGWIFVTSPNTVTPFHMDKEHNFILQIKGHKRLYVWEPDDLEAVSEQARDLFHAQYSRDRVQWREELRSRAHVFDLAPGMGAYMPSTAPHMVETGDGASVTVSFTYYTDATRRDARLHALHHRLRDRGVALAPVDAYPLIDTLIDTGFVGARAIKRGVDALRGRHARSDKAPYAYASNA